MRFVVAVSLVLVAAGCTDHFRDDVFNWDATLAPGDLDSPAPFPDAALDSGGTGDAATLGDAATDLVSSTPSDLLPGSPPYHPFGSTTTYPGAAIYPSESASARNAAVKAAYDDWKSRYLVSGCAADRKVVKYGTDSANLTVSEAHGYGMIITALMAGYDADAQSTFDDMYRYYDAHHSEYDLSSFGFPTNLLMAWHQNDQCTNTLDACDATDGDVDIAYALLLADAQWGSNGDIDYKTRALAIIDQLMDALIEGSAATGPSYITIGDCILGDAAWQKRTRPSDFILAEFRAFRAASGDARWDTSITAMIDLSASLQTNHSSSGLLPDFVDKANTAPEPAAPNIIESAHDGQWYANSCRTPWRIGQEAVFFNTAASKAVVSKMTTFMRSETSDDPKKICSGYDLDGTPLDACDWHSLEYVAPFAVAAMIDADNAAWLDAIWAIMKDPSLIAAERQYYGDTINLLTMLVVSGNWWLP